MTRLTIPLTLLAVTLVLAIVYALCVAAEPDRALVLQRVSVSCRPIPLVPANARTRNDRA